jgi:Sulfotransferase domain
MSAASGAWRALGRVLRGATAALRPLPDFLVIGAQKGGTTSLFRYLEGHPRVSAPCVKEIHFFDDAFGRGTGWYRAHFPLRRPGSRCRAGEATPYYLFHPRVPERVRATLARAQLVALLRDPVDRAFSHHQHETRAGRERLGFEEAVEAEAGRLASEPAGEGYAHRHFSYLARGIYADQMERWLRFFPRTQMLVLASEELYASPAEVMDQVYAFLGLEPHGGAAYAVHNPGGYSAGPAPETRARLAAFFAPHNSRLEALLGRGFGWDAAGGAAAAWHPAAVPTPGVPSIR